MRIPNYLFEQRVPFDSLLHAPAFCASRRARYLHAAGREVARAVLLVGPDGFFLAVLPSTHEIDLDRLTCYWGGPIRLARIDEIARVFFDCEWGTVPAFGNLYGLPTLLDASIDANDDIVFEVGSHFVDVRLPCQVYERLTGALRLDFARAIKSR